MSKPTSEFLYGRLQAARRVWAIAAIHGQLDRAIRLHDVLCTRLMRGDRIVYLGNMIGHSNLAVETIDEILAFRRHALTLSGAEPWDIVFLRGAQEEMWMKVAQLQFAPDPRGVLHWMIDQGVGATLSSYGIDVDTGERCCREGALSIMRWTATILNAVHARPGHDEIYSSLYRYATTGPEGLLFVNAGLDANRPLSQQRDTFWWGGNDFDAGDEPYGDFIRVVRGFDRLRGRGRHGRARTSIDGGCGFGGTLNAACFMPDGTMVDWIEA